jgi:hypothetical protein
MPANYRPIDCKWAKEGQCRAVVWRHDVPRYTGRGPGGFEMHYNKTQCKRKATHNGYCWQHHYVE